MGTRNLRRNKRFEFRAPVDISLNHQRVSFGTLIDISVSGLGFFASPPLQVGETYLVSVRDIASFQCKIAHCTNNRRYGGQLILSEDRKRRLAKRLAEAVEKFGLKEAD